MPPTGKPAQKNVSNKPAAAPVNAPKGTRNTPSNKGPAQKGKTKPAEQDNEHGVDPEIQGMIDELDDTWANSEEKPGFGEIKDGKYQVRLRCVSEKPDDNVGLNRSKSSARPQCTFECTIVNGEYANRKVWKRDGLDNEESIGWFKAGLSRLGIEPPNSMRDLPKILAELNGTYAQVNIKNKDGFTNVYFDKALDSNEVETQGLESVDDSGDTTEVVDDTAPTNEVEWKVGMKCQVDFNGDWYSGVIKKMNGGKATVHFEDGDTQVVELNELVEFTGDEEVVAANDDTADEAQDDSSTADETQSVSAVEITFDDSGISEAEQKAITTLATKYEFNPDDYAEWHALLCDIAEYAGVSGKFTKAALLIKKIQSVK